MTDGSWWRVLTKRGPLEKGMENHFNILALRTPWTVWKGKINWHWKINSTLKDKLPRLVGAPYATGEEWRNNSRKKEEMEPKWKQHPVVDATGDGSKVWCCKIQYCIWTQKAMSTNQSKLEVVKQEMVRVNIDTFRNQWTKMDWNVWI